MRVPDFLVRQFYVAGSLQVEDGGFRLQARNGIGHGTLVGIGRISVDGADIDLATVTATREGDPSVHRAAGRVAQFPRRVQPRRPRHIPYRRSPDGARSPSLRGRRSPSSTPGTLTLSVSDEVRPADG